MQNLFTFVAGLYLAGMIVSAILSAGLIVRRIRRNWQAPKVYAFRGRSL
jgi:hypothetical protein